MGWRYDLQEYTPVKMGETEQEETELLNGIIELENRESILECNPSDYWRLMNFCIRQAYFWIQMAEKIELSGYKTASPYILMRAIFSVQTIEDVPESNPRGEEEEEEEEEESSNSETEWSRNRGRNGYFNVSEEQVAQEKGKVLDAFGFRHSEVLCDANDGGLLMRARQHERLEQLKHVVSAAEMLVITDLEAIMRCLPKVGSPTWSVRQRARWKGDGTLFSKDHTPASFCYTVDVEIHNTHPESPN